MILTKQLFKRSSTELEVPSKSKITVRFDVGFPNTVTIRGKGAGLSWDKGVTLKNISKDTWVYEPKDSSKLLEFKVLINDQLYEKGNNHTVEHGKTFEYTPSFY